MSTLADLYLAVLRTAQRLGLGAPELGHAFHYALSRNRSIAYGGLS